MDFSRLQFIDISMPLENDIKSDPEFVRPKIEYLKHDETVARIQTFFPGLKAEDLPDQAGWALEKIQLTTHNGTHLDGSGKRPRIGSPAAVCGVEIKPCSPAECRKPRLGVESHF